MKIKITNKTLEFIASLKRKNDKQKMKMVKSIVGKNKNIDKIFNVDDDPSITNRNDKILNNIIEGMTRQADLMPGIEVEFTAKPKVKKLNIFKRFIRLFNKNAYEREYKQLQKHNKSYKSLVIAAKAAFSNVPEEPMEELEAVNENTTLNKAEAPTKETNENNRTNVEIEESSYYDEEDKTYIEDDDIINPQQEEKAI